jgi:serine/threonine protein kinase
MQSQTSALNELMTLNEEKKTKKKKRSRRRRDYRADSGDQTRGLLADRIRRKRFQAQGQDILQDEPKEDPAVYVVREGEVLVKYTDSEGEAKEKTVGVGEVFGAEHLDTTATTAAVVPASRPSGYSAEVSGSGPVSVSVLSIKDLENPPEDDNLCNALDEVAEEEEEEESESADTSEMKTIDSLELQQKIRQAVKTNVRLEDLEKISVLGEGQYGEVWLVEVDVFQTGVDSLKQRFALKSQFKTDDTRGDEAMDAIRREIGILESLTQTTPHPGIVNLVHTYDEEECIYMLMGLIPGGELWNRIHQEGSDGIWTSGMPEASARFYIYVIADTLGFMHSQNILFRDLKPENVMLDDDGYPVLVDFGFAKRVPHGDKTFTFCGTPNYVAPEIILHSGHDKAVDYWALGVTMYEMVSGENPFYFDGMDQVTLYNAIAREQCYAYPETPSAALLDLTHQLLTKEPHQRLGSLAGGADDILKHSWFADLNLSAIRSQKYEAPWKTNSDKEVEVDEDAMEEILASFASAQEQPTMPTPYIDSLDKSARDGAVYESVLGSSRRQTLIETEINRFCKRAGEEQLDREMREEGVQALKIAAIKFAYKQKYYDHANEKVIMFPSVASCLVGYDIYEEAEKHYYDEEDEFPLKYTAALRDIGMEEGGGDEDDEYMETTAADLESDDECFDPTAPQTWRPTPPLAPSVEVPVEAPVETAAETQVETPAPPVLGSSDRQRRIEKEIDWYCKRAGEQELENAMRHEGVKALKIAANKFAYKKKYVDAEADQAIVFPSVSSCLVGYDIYEEAEKHYYDEEDEFPLKYIAALRDIAITEGGGDEDIETMELTATACSSDEDENESGEENKVSGGEISEPLSELDESEDDLGEEEEGDLHGIGDEYSENQSEGSCSFDGLAETDQTETTAAPATPPSAEKRSVAHAKKVASSTRTPTSSGSIKLKIGAPSDRKDFFQAISAQVEPDTSPLPKDAALYSPRKRMTEEEVRLAMINRRKQSKTKRGRRSTIKDTLKGLGLGDSAEIQFDPEAMAEKD